MRSNSGWRGGLKQRDLFKFLLGAKDGWCFLQSSQAFTIGQ
jgi:hypothetical protein